MTKQRKRIHPCPPLPSNLLLSGGSKTAPKIHHIPSLDRTCVRPAEVFALEIAVSRGGCQLVKTSASPVNFLAVRALARACDCGVLSRKRDSSRASLEDAGGFFVGCERWTGIKNESLSMF